jgi:signal transduction histidine kinase
MRGLLGVLREDTADTSADVGPAAPAAGAVPDGDPMAPQPGLGELDRLLAQVRGAGLPATLTVTGDTRPLAADAELSVFRIIQESLTNALKHAGPGGHAVVRLHYDPVTVEVEVLDSGGAAPGSAPPAAGGRGLTGMRERAALHGGALTAGPAGDGWRVHARIPAATPATGRNEAAPA